MDAHSEELLAKLFPPLVIRAHTQADILSKEGIEIRITQGLRSWEEQDNLFAKGRTVKSDIPCTHNGISRPVGRCPIHPFGATVTNARGGYSWHNFGLAFDLAPDNPAIPGYQPDWNALHKSWKRVIEVGMMCGLRSGRAWNDLPHFQLTGSFPVTPSDIVRTLYGEGSFAAVWGKIPLIA